uniref:Cilia- and flagella-associated protein 70 n=1 Tax=Biomphalaria glabrata TaxID=6526 RepID=A0A2C9JZF2_BIOGL
MTSDADVVHNRNADPICIKVLKAKNLRGSRGENVAFVIKVEFADRLLSESSKFDTNGDSQLDCNFTSFLNCPSDDVVALDELANKPLVFTVSEVLQKEKKQKEEKTSLLGQCCLDLSPFLRGTTHIKQTLTLCPFSGSPLENLFQENQKAELDVNVTLNQPLVTDAHFKGSNILTISLGSLYSPPESWTTMSQSYHYGASLPIPITPERENSVVFTNGLLKPAQDKDANNKQKKWANPGTASGNAAYLPTSIFSIPIEEEDGDLKGKEDVDHRNIAENDRHRVIWNMERRCFLDSTTIKVFQESIAKCRYWPLEIMRMSQPAVGKGKKDEDVSVGFHGITFLNLAPLLYPGGKISQFFLTPYRLLKSLLQTTPWKNRMLVNSAALYCCCYRLLISLVFVRPSSAIPPSFDLEAAKSEADSESQASINVEGQQYNEAKSYIMVELSLDKPLVPKRPAELLAKRVAELIPPRPMFAKRTDGAQKAVEDFHFQVASVANLILEEFREHFGDQFKDNEPQSSEDMEARRQKLVYELNSSGKYFAFKEQLKHSVVKIVREKYLRTTGFEDRQELQTFLSELYVYLIDQMHVSLGHVMAHEDQPPVPKPLTDNAQLKHFAREAEVNQNFKLAATFYKERIARDKTDANSWFDFGTFNLYIHDIPKAEECFKECISLNPSHLQGLMLYGVVCMMTERYDLAETFFESATCVEPKSVLAWTMLGLFYDAVPNEISAEMAFIEAQKLNLIPEVEPKEEEPQEESFDEDKGKTPDPQEEKSSPMSEVLKTESVKTFEDKTPDPTKTSVTGADKLVADDGNELGSAVKVCVLSSTAENVIEIESSTTPQPPESIYMQAVEWLLEVKATSFTERALGHELVTYNGPTPAYYIALAQLRLQKGEYNLAEESLNEALQLDFQSPDAWSLMGHVKYMTNDFNGARDCYERTVSFIEDARDMHSTYLRLASIYLQENKYETAKRTFLLACKRSPSCVSWLGVGIACYRLNELTEAEDALSEANILNNNDPEVWAYLSLICLKTKRQLEAEQAYKYAIKLSLDDPALLAEIHREQVIHGFGNPAF